MYRAQSGPACLVCMHACVEVYMASIIVRAIGSAAGFGSTSTRIW